LSDTTDVKQLGPEASPSEIAEVQLPREARRFMRLGWWTLLVLVGGFFLWAAWAPLSAGVPAQGVTIVESKRKTVAHRTGGIVAKILVRDMQYVHAGDSLIVLDATTESAGYEAANKEYWALVAKMARLEAERSGADEITFPSELIKAAETDEQAKRQMALQRDEYQARRASLASDLKVLAEQERIFLDDAAAKREQLKLLQEQLDGLRALAREGYATKARLWDLERQVLDLRSQIELSERRAREARLRATQRKKAYRQEVESQMTETARQLAVLEERRRTLQDALTRTVIRAPVDGYVNALAVHTVGGVVRAGEPLMEVVPTDEQLEFEVQIPAHLIEHVRPNMLAEVMLQNYSKDLPHPLEAEVVSVSADLVVSRNPNVPPHYVARLRLTAKGKQTLGSRVLQPGMPVSVLIKTGERTLLQYLIDPLVRRLHQSMTEL